jgi:hypothetical protein
VIYFFFLVKFCLGFAAWVLFQGIDMDYSSAAAYDTSLDLNTKPLRLFDDSPPVRTLK